MSNREFIFDIEADGLLDTITKIHCLSYVEVGTDNKQTLYTAKGMQDFFSQGYTYIGHYIIGYDLKALKMIYGIPKPKNVIDTLGLSWYLQPERSEYGLESYGEDYGVPKPPINDWQNLSIEEYTNRCETDCEINLRLWLDLKKKLQEIYA